MLVLRQREQSETLVARSRSSYTKPLYFHVMHISMLRAGRLHAFQMIIGTAASAPRAREVKRAAKVG